MSPCSPAQVVPTARYLGRTLPSENSPRAQILQPAGWPQVTSLLFLAWGWEEVGWTESRVQTLHFIHFQPQGHRTPGQEQSHQDRGGCMQSSEGQVR